MHVRRRITRRRALVSGVAVAATAAMVGPAGSTAAAADHTKAQSKAKPTSVLCTAGSPTSSGWNGVIERLQHDGYKTIVPANPLRGIPTDAAYIASVLESIEGPIVLGGHSYGGAAITNVAAGNPIVKALVYVAVFASTSRRSHPTRASNSASCSRSTPAA